MVATSFPARSLLVTAMTLDESLQCHQAAMEKMAGAGKHRYGQCLRPRPVEHVFQRYDVVLLAMNDQRMRGHIIDRKAPDRRSGCISEDSDVYLRTFGPMWVTAQSK